MSWKEHAPHCVRPSRSDGLPAFWRQACWPAALRLDLGCELARHLTWNPCVEQHSVSVLNQNQPRGQGMPSRVSACIAGLNMPEFCPPGGGFGL